MDNILTFAAKQYGFEKDKVHFIGDNCNSIYGFAKNNDWYILRIGQKPASFVSQTKAELDWMCYLAENGINVPTPLPTIHGERLTTIQDGENHYIVCVYSAFAGQMGYQHWDKNKPALWNNALFYNWGKLMGDMHRLTKDYTPANETDKREHFDRFALDSDNIKMCPAASKVAEELLREIELLPRDKDSYGLIHADFHQWNFLIRDGEINIFDFDDAIYGWFALDIGIALYHALWWGRRNDAGHDFTTDIIKNFMDGYLSTNHLDDFWLNKIPLFMRYRQICKFSWFYDPTNVDDQQEERIFNIENGVLFTGCEINPSLFRARS